MTSREEEELLGTGKEEGKKDSLASESEKSCIDTCFGFFLLVFRLFAYCCGRVRFLGGSVVNLFVDLGADDILPVSLQAPLMENCRKALACACRMSWKENYACILASAWNPGNEFIRVVTALACCEAFRIPKLILKKVSIFLQDNFVPKRGIEIILGNWRWFRRHGGFPFPYAFQ
jgi:hypothetical protein